MEKIKTIEDVVNYQLCTGCGMCASAEPDRYAMKDNEDLGRRPEIIKGASDTNGEAIELCPGLNLDIDSIRPQKGSIKSLEKCWGPILGIWEAYSSDPEIRHKASSGGACTALAQYGLEQGEYNVALQSGMNSQKPHLNQTKQSKDRDTLLANAGSRYSPASPCEGIHTLAENDKAIFIGKPCDVAAVRKLQSKGFKKIGITIGFFCAGTPSTKGNKQLIEKASGVNNLQKLISLKYRGLGWPGTWELRYRSHNSEEEAVSMSYPDSWGYLQKFRQWRCYICPDHTSEFADISVGDPWYREVSAHEPGRSIVLARTERGLQFLKNAEKSGLIVLEPCAPDILPMSQPNLIRSRGDLWARLLTLRLFGVPTPSYKGFPTFIFWLTQLSLKQKIQSIYGTFRRIGRKNLRQSQDVI